MRKAIYLVPPSIERTTDPPPSGLEINNVDIFVEKT